MSQSMSEDDTIIKSRKFLIDENLACKQKPKKKLAEHEEDHEGYIASNSDNNIES